MDDWSFQWVLDSLKSLLLTEKSRNETFSVWGLVSESLLLLFVNEDKQRLSKYLQKG